MNLKLATLAFALSFLPHMAFAAGEVNVEADQMEIIDTQNKTIFSGNVIATRPTDQIRSDKMVVSSSEKKQDDGSVKTVTDLLDATGNVTITTKTQTITGSAAKFYVQKDKLVVSGNVVVTEGSSVIRGTLLNVDLKTNNLTMTGGRVKTSFTPK